MKLASTPLGSTPGLSITIVSESLDSSNCRDFKQDIQPLLESAPVAILDMSQLKFVDSSGLGTLLSCLRTMNNKSGKLLLVGLAKPVRAVFELVRMHRIFSIHETREEALAELSGS
ncbi:MAG: hypothetical protein RLZZ200_415 [Pseudomonadota bacterium]|jgi:anti-sigma B factor antagonist